MKLQTRQIILFSLTSTLALSGCGKSGSFFSNGNSSSTTTTSSSLTGTSSLSARALSPVFCQSPPYSLDNPLPICPAPVTNTCAHSQVLDDNGNCVDYVCDSVTELKMPTDGSLLQIPDRASGTHGICYSVQLMSAIPNGPSYLTGVHDLMAVTRNHDLNAGDPTNHWNPYLMAQAQMQFEMSGAHAVLLAGAADDSSAVKIDNFVIVGISPVGAATPIQPAFYGAFGTSDSTTTFAGGVGHILLSGVPLQLVAFASGGTASVGPLNVSSEVTTNVPYNLDVRAEDCGGSRELSNVYILFR